MRKANKQASKQANKDQNTEGTDNPRKHPDSTTAEEGGRGRPCRGGPNDVLGGLSAHSYHPLHYRHCGQG